MKKKVLLLSALLPVLCSAQSVVCYTYDSAGNRERQFYPSNRQHSSFGSNTDRESSTTHSREVAGHTVSVTTYGSGLVGVEILGLTAEDDCQLALYSLKGEVLQSLQAETVQTTLDLGNYRMGIYILQVTLNGKKESWKIVKR